VKWVANAVRKCDGATVKDYEGNVYNTVVIGDLCWTRENMRATKYYNATTHSYVDITDGSSQELYPSIPYRYNSNDRDITIYGYLYNWLAAAGNLPLTTASYIDNAFTRGICPEGWHLPSFHDASYFVNEDYAAYAGQCNGGWEVHEEVNSTVYNAVMLVEGETWKPSCDGHPNAPCDYNNVERNSTGFSAVKAGRWEIQDDEGQYMDYGAIFWTYLHDNCGGGFVFHIYPDDETVEGFAFNYETGASVRCVKDE
jgi:uncharacterized protein (TIGR02145 family)